MKNERGKGESKREKKKMREVVFPSLSLILWRWWWRSTVGKKAEEEENVYPDGKGDFLFEKS